MSTPRHIENVALDDEDLGKRNEALIIENEVLSEQVLESQLQMFAMAQRVNAMHGVQEMGIVEPEDVRKLYTAIQAAIEAFVGPMDQSIREDQEHKKRVMNALKSEGNFMLFRAALGQDSEFRAAAMDPMTCIIDIWTTFIWRVLDWCVFNRDGGFGGFYDIKKEGPHSASYYITNIHEMDSLMGEADPPVFGLYARRLWKRQALATIFRTAQFDWVEQSRAARIEQISGILQNAFVIFAGRIPRAQRMELTRNIVTAAVRLNEHIQIEADDIWTVQLSDLTGENDDHFYNNMKDFYMKPVGTTIALRDNAPLETISERLNPDEVRGRVEKLCVVSPALRYQHIEGDGLSFKDTADLVKPQVLVALKQLPRAAGEDEPAAPEPDELVFFNLAKSMSFDQ